MATIAMTLTLEQLGATLRTVEAPLSGVVLFLVSALAMNADDPLLAIGA